MYILVHFMVSHRLCPLLLVLFSLPSSNWRISSALFSSWLVISSAYPSRPLDPFSKMNNFILVVILSLKYLAPNRGWEGRGSVPLYLPTDVIKEATVSQENQKQGRHLCQSFRELPDQPERTAPELWKARSPCLPGHQPAAPGLGVAVPAAAVCLENGGWQPMHIALSAKIYRLSFIRHFPSCFKHPARFQSYKTVDGSLFFFLAQW